MTLPSRTRIALLHRRSTLCDSIRGGQRREEKNQVMLQTVHDVGVAIDAVLVINFTLMTEVLLPELGVTLHALFLATVGIYRRHYCVWDVSNGRGVELRVMKVWRELKRAKGSVCEFL